MENKLEAVPLLKKRNQNSTIMVVRNGKTSSAIMVETKIMAKKVPWWY